MYTHNVYLYIHYFIYPKSITTADVSLNNIISTSSLHISTLVGFFGNKFTQQKRVDLFLCGYNTLRTPSHEYKSFSVI